MQFTYKALKKDGTPSSGTIDAADRTAAMSTLTRQGLHPLTVKAGAGGKGWNGQITIGNFGKKVKTTDLVVFTRQFSTMISAGVPLARGLTTLQESPNTPYFREVLAGVTKDVENGTQLADAFAKFPNVFDEVFVNMVRAGEEGGILDEILKRLALQVELNASIKKKIKGAMTYPTVILSVTVIAFFGIMLVIMPKIAKIFNDLGGPGAQLPIYTRVLLTFSHLCQKYAIFMILIAGAIGYLVRRYIRTPKGKYQFHNLMLHMPVVKTIITKVAIARFSRTFSSLMAAGVGVLDSLAVTGGAIGNKVIEKELAHAAQEVKNGRQLSDVLAESPHFPRIVSQMLAVGEETGKTDVVLVKVADFYEEEVGTTIDSLASIIEPVMIIFMGAGVGLIAASVMGPIANLSTHIH
ncbi:MAG TPA: type II secretion system F family protein [Candidatus Saccharimonadales bacterium]|nr:type II secretion system F family protein [Candidatus Saccharimonadales bacterium]